MERIYEDSTVTAKKIRAALKAAFKDIKFSVRTSKYSGGSSIDISWTDGATVEAVEAITDKFTSGNFNGMEDIYETSGYEFEGKIYVGAKYIFTRRDLSPELKAQIQAKAAEMNEDFEVGCWGYPRMMAKAEAALNAPAEVAADPAPAAELTSYEIEAIVETIGSAPAAAAKAAYISMRSKANDLEFARLAAIQQQHEAAEEFLLLQGIDSGKIIDFAAYRLKHGAA